MPGTVSVACKLPHGLVLRLFDMVDENEAQAGGGYKTVKKARPRQNTVTIKGYLAEQKASSVQLPAIGSSFAITHGVDKDFFEAWLKQNEDLDAVRNHLVFAGEKNDTVRGLVNDHKDQRCGLEPIDPSKLKGRVTTGDEQKFPKV